MGFLVASLLTDDPEKIAAGTALGSTLFETLGMSAGLGQKGNSSNSVRPNRRNGGPNKNQRSSTQDAAPSRETANSNQRQPQLVPPRNGSRRDFYVQNNTVELSRSLPGDRYGVPTPDSPYPHTQLGRSKPKYGAEPQAREWRYGSNSQLQPTRDIDFTDHGTPAIHPYPHQHLVTPNNITLAPKGGFIRGGAMPL